MAERQDCVCGASAHDTSGCPVLKQAVTAFGRGARIGRNAQYNEAPYYVGVYDRGEWKSFGAGTSWEEAHANVKKVKFQRGNGRFVYEEEKKT